MTFPLDDYTPHGFLATPHSFARSWRDGAGGNLRSLDDRLGFGWVYPWARDAVTSAGVALELECDGMSLRTRADFERVGLSSPYHSSKVFRYSWRTGTAGFEVDFFQVGSDALGLELRWQPGGRESRRAKLGLVPTEWSRDDSPPPHRHLLNVTHGEPAALDLSRRGRVRAVLARGDARPDDDAVVAARRRALECDRRFWRGATRLEGDWPDHWRRGWVYDLETTRMCVMEPGGIFGDAWPSWMVQWPRAVLAENALDMARLAHADPVLAKRALATLFRDAPAPNIPCVFLHGEPNMVASDGAVCGTSPAWCVPFFHIERLWLRTVDRAWLRGIFPALEQYLEWWLAHRTDAHGWAAYKCTWEAGEDDTPRLDPERRGDNVVSGFVHPVELQAAIALSANVLARLAAPAGHADRIARWRAVASKFAAKTQEMWDPAAGRFRDWDVRAGRFVEPAAHANYWGVDPCRYSALAFVPLLAGLATSAQAAALARELEHYARPPWTMWPSWSHVVLEAATAGGFRQFAGGVATDIVDRVYRELDRRSLPDGGPLPGVAREYWPVDLADWRSCEGYGWGATTADFVVRQIFGFLESPDARGIRFELAPNVPAQLARTGRRFALANIPYRGTRLAVDYTLGATLDGSTPLQVSLATSRTARPTVVNEEGGEITVQSDGTSHRWALVNGARCSVQLR